VRRSLRPAPGERQLADTRRITSMSAPIRPPFTLETALAKVQATENAWNSRDPDRVALAYMEDSEWRNRSEIFRGRDAIRAFLRRKWAKEIGYQLKKELWAFGGNRIAVRFEYEWHDEEGRWYRSYGNEMWEFDDEGLMARRFASINDAPIDASERRIFPGRARIGADRTAVGS
jgi:nuclear transport factor 2 (NTF2) superfamily protein